MGGRACQISLAGEAAFEGLMWRYPDFVTRAQAAYDALTARDLTLPRSVCERTLTGLDAVAL
jgi:hypothetical protein